MQVKLCCIHKNDGFDVGDFVDASLKGDGNVEIIAGGSKICMSIDEADKIFTAVPAIHDVPTSVIKFPLDDDNFGAICNCAVRYALGRRTYMVGLVCNFLKWKIDKLSWRTVCCMERDIREARDYGDRCDYNDWMEMLSILRKVMKEKGYESWQ